MNTCIRHTCSLQPQMKMCGTFTDPQIIQDEDEVVSSSDSEKCIITSLVHQWMLCSEWVPSEWESDKNITIIHIIMLPPVKSGPVRIRREICTDQSKTALNKYMFEFWYQRQQEMDFSPGGCIMDYVLMDLYGFSLLKTLTDGLEWCGLLWCFYQTLILTAPIHCRASIAETLMQWHTSLNLMKKTNSS